MHELGLTVQVRQEKPITLDVSLTCDSGELLALVGPSGSGKTTLLRTIAGLYRPQLARVVCDGMVWLDTTQRINLPPHARSVGLVFQSYALFPHMTALGNVMAALAHRPRSERETRARALLDLVHLAGLELRKPAELSGGQQQRVAVARALARDPKVLLLDEPFSAVDKVTRQRLYAELGELRRNLNIPIIVVTHDFDEAARLADRICLLHRGVVLQTGSPGDVFARPISVEAARLVDLKNMFDGRIVAQQPEHNATVLAWGERRVEAQYHPNFTVGDAVVWAVPSTQIILHRGDLPITERCVNPVGGVVKQLVSLRESTSIVVAVENHDEQTLSLTVPAHFVRRTNLDTGSRVTICLLPEGIHLIGVAPGAEPRAWLSR